MTHIRGKDEAEKNVCDCIFHFVLCFIDVKNVFYVVCFKK